MFQVWKTRSLCQQLFLSFKRARATKVLEFSPSVHKTSPLYVNSIYPSYVTVNLYVNCVLSSVLIDTGAAVSLVNLSVIGRTPIRQTNHVLKSVIGENLEIRGIADITFLINSFPLNTRVS